MTGQIPGVNLDAPMTVATWPYLYFVSYAYPQGFGHHHVRFDQPVRRSSDITRLAELVSEGTGTPREHLVVLNYQLMSGPDDNPSFDARLTVAELALRDLLSMVDQFDTPRDPGRVQAFVGDVRQVALRGLGHTRG